jgi:hypothetical protein
MAKIKVLCGIGEFDDEYLAALKTVVEKVGGRHLRLRIIPDSEHCREHLRVPRTAAGIRRIVVKECARMRRPSRSIGARHPFPPM